MIACLQSLCWLVQWTTGVSGIGPRAWVQMMLRVVGACLSNASLWKIRNRISCRVPGRSDQGQRSRSELSQSRQLPSIRFRSAGRWNFVSFPILPTYPFRMEKCVQRVSCLRKGPLDANVRTKPHHEDSFPPLRDTVVSSVQQSADDVVVQGRSSFQKCVSFPGGTCVPTSFRHAAASLLGGTATT